MIAGGVIASKITDKARTTSPRPDRCGCPAVSGGAVASVTFAAMVTWTMWSSTPVSLAVRPQSRVVPVSRCRLTDPQRRRRCRGDRGEVTATVLMVPLVLLAMMLVVRFRLAYAACAQMVSGAAQDGAAAATSASPPEVGAALAEQLISEGAGSLLTSHSASGSSDGERVYVEASGDVVTVLPFFRRSRSRQPGRRRSRSSHRKVRRHEAPMPRRRRHPVWKRRSPSWRCSLSCSSSWARCVTNSGADVDAAARARRLAAAGRAHDEPLRRRPRRSPGRCWRIGAWRAKACPWVWVEA